MQNNFVAYADANIVQYATSTLPGSSGSPVFDDEFKVVAIITLLQNTTSWQHEI